MSERQAPSGRWLPTLFSFIAIPFFPKTTLTKPKITILAISGSTRKSSTNERLIEFITARFKHLTSIELFEGVDTLPHFVPGDEHLPSSVADFRHKIETADAVLFCTPEYVFSLPGSLKNAIEWLVSTTILFQKPTAFIIASASGEKAFEELELILKTLEARVDNSSKLLIQGAKGKISQDGEIENPVLLSQIDDLMRSLLSSVA